MYSNVLFGPVVRAASHGPSWLTDRSTRKPSSSAELSLHVTSTVWLRLLAGGFALVPEGAVGPSGGGKTTLMDMIPRFIQPDSGCILIDDKDIQSYLLTSLRSNLGIVGQDSILFNDTIFNNIAFGQSGVSTDQVKQAAIIANAHDFILATEKGYDTNIGDRGVKLSGGQRQRICIARAVLNNPPIMLLDEATSALDTESEKNVQEAINNLMKQRTSVIIAHRLSTIQHADQIIVLDKGIIAEQGTYAELMNSMGLFRKLVDMQTFETSPDSL